MLKKSIDEAGLKEHGIKRIEFEDGFSSQVADLFFSHVTGARGLQPVTDTEIPQLITSAILDKYDESSEGKEATIKVSLVTQDSNGKVVAPSSPDIRKVALRLTINSDGAITKTYETDLTGKANLQKVLLENDRDRTRVHEAAHALTNEPELTGEHAAAITVKSGGERGGYVRFEATGTTSSYMERKQIVAKIARMLAGGIAEETFFSDYASSSRSNDLLQARQLAQAAIVDHGLTKNALKLPIGENGKVIVKDPVVQKEVQDLLAEGDQLARRLVKERWTTILDLANKLDGKPEIEGQELHDFINASTAKRRSLQTGSLAQRIQCLVGAFRAKILKDQ
jgi:hypothetical protein